MTIAFEQQHLHIVELLKSHQLPASGRHGPHHFQMAHQHHEMALRQQRMSQQQPAYTAYPNPLTSHHHDMMVDMQPMPLALEHYSGPEMQLPLQGQTFGDVGYPVSSSMDLGIPGSASLKPMNTSLLFLEHTSENGEVHTPTGAAPQHFYPTLTSSQLPVNSVEHPSPPTTYHQHSTVVPTTVPPTTIPTSYSQPQPVFSCGVPQPDPTTSSYSAYPASVGHFPVMGSTSDSEQRIVSELITSVSESFPPQQQLHSPPQQQPHSASFVHSNRSPSALYLSPHNSGSLQHSSEVAQQNGVTTGAYHHANPPSLTSSPEGCDETHNITTMEGLVQQHDYPSVLYGGTDSYTYGGIRFALD